MYIAIEKIRQFSKQTYFWKGWNYCFNSMAVKGLRIQYGSLNSQMQVERVWEAIVYSTT